MAVAQRWWRHQRWKAGVTVSIGGKGARGGDGKAVEVTNREDSSTLRVIAPTAFLLRASAVVVAMAASPSADLGGDLPLSVAAAASGGNAGTVDVVMSETH